jgi:uncharacterized protein HemY
MYRQRGNDGDQELALAAYTKSAESETAPPEAHKNLGYLYLKGGNLARAQDSFRQYLELQPGATDRAMIEYYLEEDAQ